MTDEKKLVRPLAGRWIAGVCAGIGKHFGLDPTLVRVAWTLFFCLGGAGLLGYLICWIIIPNERRD
jgi:phage shock protein C